MLTFAGQAPANQFFQECSEALEKPEFVTLRRYLDSKPELPRPNKCFRLNNNQFLVTVTSTGRVSQGLYYYDAKTNTYGLDGGSYMPNVDVVQEFTGPHNKRYVLLAASNLSRGNWWQGYSILNLMPTKEGKSYVHYSLVSSTEDPESGLCGTRITTGKASSVKEPRITNEGTESVEIIFFVTVQDCVTSEIMTYSRTFSLNGGAFKEVKK
jgi:hypothetical protein